MIFKLGQITTKSKSFMYLFVMVFLDQEPDEKCETRQIVVTSENKRRKLVR